MLASAARWPSLAGSKNGLRLAQLLVAHSVEARLFNHHLLDSCCAGANENSEGEQQESTARHHFTRSRLAMLAMPSRCDGLAASAVRVQ